jgi:cytochrome c biogenesis protein CcmG/thiol:disulfide interchange protein DsbE
VTPQLMRALPLFILLLLAAALGAGLLTHETPAQTGVSLVGYQPGPFELPSLPMANQPAGKFSPKLWQGQVAVLNVFASWCEPCAAEHPVLMRLAQTGKVAVYGIGWKDKPASVTAWLNARGNPYQAVGIDQYGAATIALSMTGVPETYVLKKDGSVFYHHKSPIDNEIVDKVILPLVEKLNAGEL